MPNLFKPKDQNAPKRLAEKAKMKPYVKVVIAASALLIAAFIGGSVWALYSYDLSYPGLRAGSIAVSGMNREELVSRLDEENQRLFEGKHIDLTIRGIGETVSTEEIGAGIDAEKASDKILAFGRTGSYFKRVSDLVGALIYGTNIDILSVDEQALKNKAEQIRDSFMEKVQSSDYEIKEDKLILYLANRHIELKAETIFNAVLERLQDADFSPLTIEPAYQQLDEPDFDLILSQIETEPQNARLDLENDPSGGTILPHIIGVKVDHEQAKRLIENRGNATEIEIPITITEPEVTMEELKEVLFRDVLSEVTTMLNPALVNRTSNVKLAAEYVNGEIINPGGEFSYNEVVGMRTLERGFKDAKVFENGEIVDGIGGGICQVSSTIYMAALRSDLKINERRNHQFTVAYAPLGQDATVVYGSTDFRFENNTPYPIKVESYQKGNSVTVRLYGTKTENKEVKLSTTVLEKTPYESRTTVDPALKPGEKVVDSEGHTGYKTVTYRVVYIDGKEVRREIENKSTYKKLDYVDRIGQTAIPAKETGQEEEQTGSPQDDALTPEEGSVSEPGEGPVSDTASNNQAQSGT